MKEGEPDWRGKPQSAGAGPGRDCCSLAVVRRGRVCFIIPKGKRNLCAVGKGEAILFYERLRGSPSYDFWMKEGGAARKKGGSGHRTFLVINSPERKGHTGEIYFRSKKRPKGGRGEDDPKVKFPQ